ncbi:MAG TPA: glutathione S-transferase family protein [Polyangiaceae bacterium]|jgi:glutathione S-transferase|nr:glutathione S-transferase family protein [Polyangiaceae bacterium]
MSKHAAEKYELYYWPQIQGRGEFVRLALEDAGADYVDVARLPKSEGGGVSAITKILKSADQPAFAPPILKIDGRFVAQTHLILQVLAPRLGLVPGDDASRIFAHQLELTVSDLIFEVHETHHPIASGLYYEDQKPEAARRTGSFLEERVPKYLGYFERVLEKNGGKAMVGDDVSYVDLSMFQILAGLEYAFPRALAAFAPKVPLLRALATRVAGRERLAAYLASARRIPFNEDGIFRRYPELDQATG